ncbi:MAG: diguanylate cyclase [Nitrospirae bacterium]|nr:diguanylate cyclase [Nitrospirota bacterium]MBF0539844.1 diguanylate cyclase [Nitrospirota bacterium]
MKILISEDDDVSRRMLESILVKWQYEVMITDNGIDALSILLSDNAPGIAILDWMMPQMTGVEVCKEIRKHGKEPYTYLILLTSKGRKEDLVYGIEAGADDYITKPFNMQELKVRLRAGTRIVELSEQLISARDAMQIAATHDSLTGIWNRAAIFDTFKKEFSRANREKKPISIILADLDFFKKINDRYGHPAGDEVLRETSKIMKELLRQYDTCGRYGGEEFLIVLPGCNSETASVIAQRLCHLIESHIINIPGHQLKVTCSMGVATLANFDDIDKIDLKDMNMLLKIADVALYQAKNDGRNCVRSLFL